MLKQDAQGVCLAKVDAIDDGEHYTLVFEWARYPGKEGEYPKRTLSLPKSVFQQSQSLSSGYELFLTTPVDLTTIKFEDVDADEDQIWTRPQDLFQPRPQDEGT